MGVCYRSIDINDGKFWKAPHAAAIFIGPTLEAEDNRRDYGEVRVQAIGNAGDDILSVVYSDRGDVRRIISARLANRKERKLWHSFIEHWNKSAE